MSDMNKAAPAIPDVASKVTQPQNPPFRLGLIYLNSQAER